MKAFNKDIVRSIRHSLGRFVAIAAIVALGCGFYAGLRMTAPDMKLAADAYYDGTDLMDIRVVSTLGLTEEDIEALRDVPGVSGVEAAYSADVLATLNDEQYVMRVHSLSPSAATAVKVDEATISSDDANYLNRLDLVEGRWPTSANECVIFNDRVMSGPTGLGDTVTVDPSVGNVEDTLATTEFTVVGRVHSPLYVSSTSMGTSTIGSGTIEQFMYVLPEAFDADMPYVEAYVSVEGAAELPADSDAYDDRVAGVVAAIEGIAPAREQARVDDLKAEAQADLDEARAEYEKEEARAKTELADARAELDAAKEELDEGQRNALIALLEDLPEYCTLIFIYDTLEYKRDGKMKKLCAALDKYVCAVEFAQQERAQLVNWLRRRFTALGHDIDPITADHLLFTCGTLMTELVPEIEKIAAYARQERITIDDINAVADPVLDARVFDMTNCVTAGKYDEAARVLADLLRMQTEPIMILAALGKELRRLYTARMALDSGKDRFWLKQLWGMSSDYPAKLLMQAAKKVDHDWCSTAVIRCQKLDRRMKSERGMDSEAELKLFLMELAGAR